MEKRKSKLLILSTTALLGLATAGVLFVSNNSEFSHSGSVITSASDVEMNISLNSSNGVSSSGEKAYDGVSEGATGAIKVNYAGVKEQGESLHVTLNNEGSIAIPVNRMTKLVVKATGTFIVEYGESSSIAGGKEMFVMGGLSQTITFPAEVNFAKITAASELAVESIGIGYMVNGNCTAKADDTYENGLLNGSDVYYGNEKVTYNTKEYSHKVKLSDFSRLELTLSKEDEDDIVYYFMYVGTEGNTVTFEDSKGNSVSLSGSSLLEKTATISLNGEGMNVSYAKLQKLNSFNLDDYGSYDIVVGEGYQIHAINFNPSNATFKNVVWTSTDESVASVEGSGEDNATGNVDILATGTSVIGAYVISDPEEGTKVTAARTVTFNAVASIALPSTFEGDNWVSSFSDPDFELEISGGDIVLRDHLNDKLNVSLHVAYKSGSTYYLADSYGYYLLGASYSDGHINIAQNYMINGVVHPGTGTIEFSKEEAITSVKATIGGVEYASAGSAYQMIAGDDSGYITFSVTGGNNYEEIGVEAVITDDPLDGVPEPTPVEATLPGTWTGEGYTVVVNNNEDGFVINGGEFDNLEAFEEYGYFYDEGYEHCFAFSEIENGKVDLVDYYGDLDITLSKEGYTPVEPRKDVFTYENGFIKSNREGAGYVKKSWRDNADGGAIKSAYLYVEIAERVTVASVALSTDPASAEVAINGEITINAAITSSSAGKLVNKSNISWSKTSDDGQGTKVSSNDTSYVFKGTKAGSVTITWTDSVSGVSESIVVTVTDAQADVVPEKMQGTWIGYDDYYSDETTFVISKDGTLEVTDNYGFFDGRVFTLTGVNGDEYTFEDTYDNTIVITFDEGACEMFVTGEIDGYISFEDTEFLEFVG